MLGDNKESHDFIRASTISDGALAGDCIKLGTSGNCPERRKMISAPMSAIGVLSALVLLTSSSSAFAPTATVLPTSQHF
jgi:hypothetical protein